LIQSVPGCHNGVLLHKRDYRHMSVTDRHRDGPPAGEPEQSSPSFEALTAEALPRLLGASGSQLEPEVHFFAV
jgi:hypothetical protein